MRDTGERCRGKKKKWNSLSASRRSGNVCVHAGVSEGVHQSVFLRGSVSDAEKRNPCSRASHQRHTVETVHDLFDSCQGLRGHELPDSLPNPDDALGVHVSRSPNPGLCNVCHFQFSPFLSWRFVVDCVLQFIMINSITCVLSYKSKKKQKIRTSGTSSVSFLLFAGASGHPRVSSVSSEFQGTSRDILLTWP